MVANLPHTPLGIRRRLAVAVLCAAVVAALLTGASGASARSIGFCPHARTPVSARDHAELQRAVVCLINRQRTARHLPALQASAKLDVSAQRWTHSMVADQRFTHGHAFFDRISAVGFDWENAGENIATGFTTPQTVVRAWMASPGHCANILDPRFREVGTGIVDGAIRGDSSAGATWTQDFGRLMGQTALSQDFGPARACYR